MICRWLLRRAIARLALTCLAVGIAALAALAIVASLLIEDTTAQVRTFNDVTARWQGVSSGINAEHAALNAFIANNGAGGKREPLVRMQNSAADDLRWLEDHGGPGEAGPARIVTFEYIKYGRQVHDIVMAADQHEPLDGYSAIALRNFGRLSDMVRENVERRLAELATFLERVDRRNATLRMSMILLVVVDIVLCLASAFILIGYQRRAEAEARAQRHRALHDTLTGLANRQLLSERVDHALAEARRTGKVASLMLVDLDRFKAVNDTLGHAGGDALLQHVARCLSRAARARDTVARIGGDEFAVLVPAVESVREISEIAERMHAALDEPMYVNGLEVDFGASVGVSVFPLHCTDAEGLMRHADLAMYAAKRGGLGVALYESDRHARHVLVLPRDAAETVQDAAPVATFDLQDADHDRP